jgi:hypothetical protein
MSGKDFAFMRALCRQFAETSPYPEYVRPLLAQAERWEQGAIFLERDATAIATSRELLARIDGEMKQGRTPGFGSTSER